MTDFAAYDDFAADSEPDVPAAQFSGIQHMALPRAKWIPFLFSIPVLFAGISYLSGGLSYETDAAFVAFTLLIVLVVANEIRFFTRRFGIGLMVLLGGSLIWFCHDYFTNWYGGKPIDGVEGYPAVIIAKDAFYTTLFIFIATVGFFFLPQSKRLVQLTRLLPEPRSTNVYFMLVLFSLFIGLIPYLFFSAVPILDNLYRSFTGMRTGAGPVFTTGRTGNYNYSWGGYLAELSAIGETGGLLAAFYAIIVPGKLPLKIISIIIWLFWVGQAFGDGSRGDCIFAAFPVVMLLFIKYNTKAAKLIKKFSFRGFLYSAITAVIILLLVQIQGTVRNTDLADWDLKSVELLKNQGNAMFSEGLVAYQTFPDSFPFAADVYPGAAFIQPIPDVAMRFAIGWIPRVLWNNKPGISAAGQWVNNAISGGTAVNDKYGQEGVTGGTVCVAISGQAYMYYGVPGVIEMALLFGWLCRYAEMCLGYNLHRPLALLFALGFSAYLLRAFRDLTPHDLYPLLIGLLAMALFIKFFSIFGGADAPVQALAESD